MSEIATQFGRPLIVVAHPDDEVIGCGILLQRVKHATVAFLTDGAPADRYFWNKFGSRTAYAEMRAAETRNSLTHLKNVSTLFYGVRDQELMFHLGPALDWLRKAVTDSRPDSIITHAYEGGHPDHDSCNFLCAVIAREFELPVWEMPLYRRVNGKLTRQHAPRNANDVCLSAREKEVLRKSQMVEAYASQVEFLRTFDLATERFVPQSQHDYSLPPHKGKLNYECWGWEISGSDLCAAFRRVMDPENLKRAKSA